ncbi:MAG: hypothetical protein M1415_04035, partial [Firmicutes bacterium]|nr:hypothetical protein [Bacillota bacterium]
EVSRLISTRLDLFTMRGSRAWMWRYRAFATRILRYDRPQFSLSRAARGSQIGRFTEDSRVNRGDDAINLVERLHG